MAEISTIETQPKPFVFTLMPFEPAFDDLYKLGIKAACNDAGAHCERVDEQIFDESILQRVYNQIAKADLIVAEMTGRNPNVFYEVGYAHALGKRVILLTQRSEDIPFDLKHYPHIVHGNRISELKTELHKRVKWAVENPKEANKFFNPTLECYIGETPIISNPLVAGRDAHGNWPLFSVAINNSITRTIESQAFQFGIVVPKNWDLWMLSSQYRNSEQISTQSFRISSEQKLILAQPEYQLLPGAWVKINTQLRPDDRHEIKSVEYNLAIRLFTQSGPIDYPFRNRHNQ